uniref:Uncharacterized protein n=1 Tax=Rhizophora mucronata TaxID=61149 RepID=A0A2P2LCM4_RHIMU
MQKSSSFNLPWAKSVTNVFRVAELKKQNYMSIENMGVSLSFSLSLRLHRKN